MPKTRIWKTSIWGAIAIGLKLVMSLNWCYYFVIASGIPFLIKKNCFKILKFKTSKTSLH